MASAYPEALVPQVTLKSVTSTAATAIFSTTQLVLSFTVQAKSANTGTLFIGSSSVNSSQCISLTAGSTFSAPVIYTGGSNPMMYDLSQWYLRASGGTQKGMITKIRKEKEVS